MAQVRGENKSRKHYIAAIGASAGGLEAIHDFFDNMGESEELSFVIIQHLSSDYKSLLVELISKHTPMKVFEAEDKMLVLKQCVYVIPNNKLISIKNGKLHLKEKDIAKGPSTAVDTFLYALADEYKECAIAVILSGAGSDGTDGIRVIKENGGTVMVQDPLTAKFDGMPNSAINSGFTDLILPPEMMPEEIFKIVRGGESFKSLVKNSGGPLLDKILQLVYQQTGFDFQHYKKPTIQRRIHKHMAELNISGLEKYVSRLDENQQYVKDLGKSFLIGVTKFFRDEKPFEILEDIVIPNIIKTKKEGEVVKVWVSACSTGEEAYSIAISIDRCLQQQKKRLEVKIFATDIDETALDFASKNIFPLAAVEGLEKEIRAAYFEKSGKKYSIISRIRKQIVFAKHNIIKDPPYIHNDLVSCRNMLIYMSPVLQLKILSKLYFSVCKGAYLFLGPSESALSLKDQLTEVDGKWKIFRKTGEQKIYAHDFYKPDDFRHKESRTAAESKKEDLRKGINEEFSELLFEDFGYAAFYIDSLFDIKEAAGSYKNYLSLPEKKLNLNLLKMLPPALSGIINAGVRKARKEKQKVIFKNVQIETKERKFYINLAVKPDTDNEKNYTLIVINENTGLKGEEQNEIPVFTADEQSEYVYQLESELDELRDQLQLFKENHETVNEELQSSNEELLSANEELQSSNEELQSLNEELHTLNTEHQMKIKELLELNNDLDNYFRSTDIGQLFLDSSLCIRKFNPAATRLVNLINSDIGRPFSHISTNFKYEQLFETIQLVQQKGDMAEKEVKLKSGETILIKIFPYVRHDKVKDGVILTFIDISAQTQLNSLIKGVFNSSINPIMAFKSIRNNQGVIEDFQLVSGNEASYRLINTNTGNQEMLTLKRSFPQLLYDEFFKKYSEVVSTSRPLRSELLLNQSGVEEWYEAAAAKMLDGFVVTLTNVTERKHAEVKLRKNYNELLQAREKLKKLNVTLEDKVRKRTEQLSSSEERFRLVAKASNDVIWDWNLVTNEVWWNESLNVQFGHVINEQNISGSSFWLKNIHPQDRERVERKIFDAINTGKSMWSDNYRFQKADGTYAYIFDRGYLLYDQFNVPFRMLGSMLNVTELHQAEERIERSEAKFRRIFESNMLGMLFSDFEGKIYSANDYFLNMLGYNRTEVESGMLNWNNLTPEKYIDISRKAVKQLSRFGVSKPFEKEYIKKDGQLVPVLIGSAVVNQDDNIHAVTYVIDITDRKKAEARERQMQEIVLKNQEKLRFLADATPQKIWTAMPDGRLEYFNKVWVDYTGIKLEELQNKGWKGLVHPDDLATFKDAWQMALKTGEGIEVEQRLRRHDGHYRWHLTRSAAQKDKEGSITMWVGSSTDIHEQRLLTEEIKASEFYFRQLADQSPFMIWRIDEQGLCNYVNVQWIELTGLSFEESLGTGWKKAFYPEDAEREYKNFINCFAKKVSYHSKFRLKVKDGSSRWVIAQSNPLRNKTFEGYIGSITDITDQEMAQESLKVLMQKKDEFMSIASHELKTPITSMRASLQIVNRISAKNNTNNPVLTEFVNRASRQADKLSILVADLLDVTKIHAGKMTLNKTKINIKEVITECAEQIQAIESTHTIHIDVKPKLYVNADRHRIEQVIINFLSNAVKYSPNADKVIITAKSYQNKIRVEVKDFGIGIPKDKIHFLFSRFFRVQESSQKFSGLGLGLYISAEMIKKHDGIIGVESEDGQGSTFWFELPAIDKNRVEP